MEDSPSDHPLMTTSQSSDPPISELMPSSDPPISELMPAFKIRSGTRKAAACFWDIENVRVPTGKSAFDVIARIRQLMFGQFWEAEFITACDAKREADQTLTELNDGQIKVLHISALSKNNADAKLTDRMYQFAQCHEEGTRVVILTSDKDYSACLRYLFRTKRFEVVLIHQKNVSSSLLEFSSQSYLFEDLFGDLPTREPVKVDRPEHVLIVHGYPRKTDIPKLKNTLKKMSASCKAKVVRAGKDFSTLTFETLDHLERARLRLDGQIIFGKALSTCLPEDSPFNNNEHKANEQQSSLPMKKPDSHTSGESITRPSSHLKNKSKKRGSRKANLPEGDGLSEKKIPRKHALQGLPSYGESNFALYMNDATQKKPSVQIRIKNNSDEVISSDTNLVLRLINQQLGKTPASSFHMPQSAVYNDDDTVMKLKPMTEEDMEDKAKAILAKYLKNLDTEQATLSFVELADTDKENLHAFVSSCINEVLEMSSRKRHFTALFLHEIIKIEALSMDVFIKGLTDVIQYAEDMLQNIPRMLTYLAQLIVPVLLRGSVPLPTLVAAFMSCSSKDLSLNLITEILLTAKEQTHFRALASRENSGMDWTLFLDDKDVENFLKQKQLDFILRPASFSGQAGASTDD